MRRLALLVPLLLGLTVTAATQSLRGHGGPVRAIVAMSDGEAVTGSFDSSQIRWDLSAGSARAVLRGHDGAVNALVRLDDARHASAGEDGRILIWRRDLPEPERGIEAHRAPIAALAVSPDGGWIASASWDGTVRLTPLVAGEALTLSGHLGNVNGVGFLPDGRLASVGQDATLRLWSRGGEPIRTVQVEAPLNGLAVAADGEIIATSGDGRLRLFAADGDPVASVEIGPTPLIALALSADGTRIAAGGLRGAVGIVDRRARRVLATLVGPGLPVWSLAFAPDGRELLSGGADRLVRRWNALTGEHMGEVVPAAAPDVLAGLAGERGAEVFRACAACHTLTRDAGNRAGPTLHGLFGRRIATAEGYAFSPALKAMDIVWTKETVARLFEIGPNAYTPGTKMPEQTIAREEDRRALVDWLEKVTR
jgi:cytochrome c